MEDGSIVSPTGSSDYFFAEMDEGIFSLEEIALEANPYEGGV